MVVVPVQEEFSSLSNKDSLEIDSLMDGASGSLGEIVTLMSRLATINLNKEAWAGKLKPHIPANAPASRIAQSYGLVLSFVMEVIDF